MKTITMILAVAAIFIISARGQGFQNLNFESAYNLPGDPGDGAPVSVTNALPDWTAYAGTALSSIYYVSNNFSGFSSLVELEGGSLALSGNNLSVGFYGDSSISQIGLVPANAESLQFEAQGPGPSGSFGPSGFSVTLGGVVLGGVNLGGAYIPFSVLSEGPDYTVYGANIPADLDGQMEALIFGCQGVGSGQVLLDNIEFSPMSVPEPSEYALISLGAMLIGLYRRRKQ